MALPTRVPGTELPADEPIEPHVPPEHGALVRVLACLRASTGCWRCSAESAVAPCGEVNGPAGPVPLCLCPDCLNSPDGGPGCWRCAAPDPTLTACGETAGETGTEPLRLCPGCLGHIALTYATATTPYRPGPA